MPTAELDAITSVADRLFAAIEAGDVATVAGLWSTDVAVWQVGARCDRDKSRALRVIDWFVSSTSGRRYQVLSRQVFDGGFVQQHILHATSRTGTPVAMRVCMVILVGTDGLISRIDEYLNPAELAPLLDEPAE
ncbi:MAG: ketosteroid isomerase-like protein [Mycobacterium sp.]|nr:ketosteroid isomerase-like protein [Mycobacterium sp.]